MRVFRTIRSGIFMALFAATTTAAAQQNPPPVDPAKAAAVRTLLELTGASDILLLGVDDALREQASTKFPPGFVEEFQKKVRERIPEFIELLVPLYAAQLSLEDVNQLVAFYRTPAAQRFAKAQPLILRESGQLASRWGVTLAQETLAELAKKTKPTR
jgi:hypothetical protein